MRTKITLFSAIMLLAMVFAVPIYGQNSLIFSSPPSSVKVGDNKKVSVAYTKQGTGTAYVQLWIMHLDGSKVKEWTETATKKRGTASFDIEIPQTSNGSYKWYAQLMNSTWSDRLTYVTGPSLTIGSAESSDTAFGECLPSDPRNGVKCYDASKSDRVYDQDMGNGYWSNWYVSKPNSSRWAGEWKGPLKANFKRGTNPWVEWTNTTTDAYEHNEFDLKIRKSADRGNGGLPAKISTIQGSINTSMTGKYSSGSKGKGHINMTAWLTETGAWSGNRVDIIVHAFDNQGKFYQKYIYDGSGYETYVNMGSFGATNGKNYRVLRSRPGGAGELASYNLIPDSEVQANPTSNISTSLIRSDIDMKMIIDRVIELESKFDGYKIPINNSWHIFNLEWTVVGQSGAYNNDGSKKFIPNSKGRFTFTSYSIPNVRTSTSLKTQIAQKDSIVEAKDFSVSPNPFINSFEYEYSVKNYDDVTVDLYALNGRKIETLKNKESHRPGNYSDVVDTSDLDAGIYILRINTSKGEEAIKLIKN